MKNFSLFLLLAVSNAYGEEQRIYQRDSYGNIQYHKSSYVVQKDGRITEVDPYGNKQYHHQQYQIKNSSVYPLNTTGNAQRKLATVTK